MCSSPAMASRTARLSASSRTQAHATAATDRPFEALSVRNVIERASEAAVPEPGESPGQPPAAEERLYSGESAIHAARFRGTRRFGDQ